MTDMTQDQINALYTEVSDMEKQMLQEVSAKLTTFVADIAAIVGTPTSGSSTMARQYFGRLQMTISQSLNMDLKSVMTSYGITDPTTTTTQQPTTAS